MAYDFPVHTRNPDNTYGPTSRGHLYKPQPYHRPTAKRSNDKTRWCLTEGEEFEVFRIADEPFWYCGATEKLYSIVDGGRVKLGENGERLAAFPPPQNESDPWHGYPIPSGEYDISDELLDRWEDEGVVSETIRKRIVRGKL